MAREIKITDTGFHLRTDNGWVLSVQIGPRTYSDNYDLMVRLPGTVLPPLPGSTTAEIAAWHRGGGLVEWEDGDTIAGYVPCEQVFEVIGALAGLPDDEKAGGDILRSIVVGGAE